MKLGNFEETGAIVAAMTTSIPIAPSGGNYDLRYCWLRDAYWVVSVLNQLGATATMERYLRFLGNIVAAFHANKQSRRINSVYGISLETRLHEREMHRLSGIECFFELIDNLQVTKELAQSGLATRMLKQNKMTSTGL